MTKKQRYVATVLLMVGGFFSTTRALAAPPIANETVPLTQYWNLIADYLAQGLISRGRPGLSTIYVEQKHTALDVTQYLEKQLTVSLSKSGVKLAPPTRARYIIELDVDINKRTDGQATAYAQGQAIDHLWMIQTLDPVYPGQYAHYEMIPLSMNPPVSGNPLTGTDTEIIITARIMDRGWIRISENYAFYFNAKDTMGENERKYDEIQKAEHPKPEKAFNDDVFREFQNHQGIYLDYQKKLDADVEQLMNSFQF